MLTRIFVALLLFLIPFLLYLLYAKTKRRLEGAASSEAMTPWLMLVLSGLVIATGGIIAIGVLFDHDRDVKVRPPAYVDGEIIPAGPVE
ncbi:hypothetical protein [Pelagibius sp. Alg239-R121]|uniref:hypothetical protein n=1 Tax=Pelagibius sp. Alg239-R121 TaxID=2993448 RepID=UPI0024A6BF59|nr:hypothetical protein [Pelagibius sp. Alg239-R121]